MTGTPVAAREAGAKIGEFEVARRLTEGPGLFRYLVRGENGQEFVLVECVPHGASRGDDGTLIAGSSETEPPEAVLQREQKAAQTGLGELKLGGASFTLEGGAYFQSHIPNPSLLANRFGLGGGMTSEDVRACLVALSHQIEQAESADLVWPTPSIENTLILSDGSALLTGWGLESGSAAPAGQAAFALSELGYRIFTGQQPVSKSLRQDLMAQGHDDPIVHPSEYVPVQDANALVRALERGLNLDPSREPVALEDWVFSIEGRGRFIEGRTREAAPVRPSRMAAPQAGRPMIQSSRSQTARKPKKKTGGQGNAVLGVGVVLVLMLLAALAWVNFNPPSGDAPEIQAEPNIESPTEDSQPTGSATSAEEERAWQNAQTIDNAPIYQGFIDRFPSSQYVDEARGRIDALDDEAWQAAIGQNTESAFENYIDEFPLGKFVPEATIILERLRQQRSAAAASDQAAWSRAQQQNTIASYRTYLDTYPSGRFARDARARIEQIERNARDQQAWEATERIGTKKAYEDYLASWPQGRFVAEAMTRIEALTVKAGMRWSDCPDCPDMIVIGAGRFTQGALPDDPMALPSEKPQRQVSIGEMFGLSVREVTAKEYRACVADGACSANESGSVPGNYPIVYVSWEDAQSYVSWLSETTGKTYRLPTESEWEFAARAGSSDIFPGGSQNALCRSANIAGAETQYPWRNQSCADNSTEMRPVGSGIANGWGLEDMIGNAAEWTEDCASLDYRDAPSGGVANQRGLCGSGVARGGSFLSGPKDSRFSTRAVRFKSDRDQFTGIRVAADVPPQ